MSISIIFRPPAWKPPFEKNSGISENTNLKIKIFLFTFVGNFERENWAFSERIQNDSRQHFDMTTKIS